MKIAVIIVNYNDVDDTIKYVKKITKYEIISRIVIVDNNSTSKNALENLKVLENEKVKVIQSDKNGGYNYGNNFGIKYLESQNEKYDYFIISNPDIEVSEKAIKHCLEEMEKDTKIAVISPRMFNKDSKPIRRSSWKKRTFTLDVIHSTRLLEIIFYKILRSGEYSEKDYEKEILEVQNISGAFFIIKSNILKDIGYFDENVFLFYEEDILAEKLAKTNYKIISLNSEKFIHYESQTIGKTLNYYKKTRELFKSKMYFQKEYNKINFIQSFIFYFLYVFRNIELIIEIPIRKLLNK